MGLFDKGGGGGLVGIDVGASSIKILRGNATKNSFQVEKFIAVPIPYKTLDERGIVNAGALSKGIADGFAELAEKSPKVAAAIGGMNVLTKRVVIPKIPRKEIPNEVRWEAEQVFSQDVNEILVDYLELGEDAQVPGAPEGTIGWDLLLVGVRREEASRFRELLEGANCKLRILDLDAFVVGDFLKDLVPIPNEGSVAYVDVGATGTRVCIQREGKVIFIREFVIGGNTFTEAISQSLGVSFPDAEALKIQAGEGIPQEIQGAIQSIATNWIAELQQCEDLFISQEPNGLVARWYLFGGGSLTPGFYDLLRQERFGEKLALLPASDLIQAKGKDVDPSLLATWSMRLITAAGLGSRKG